MPVLWVKGHGPFSDSQKNMMKAVTSRTVKVGPNACLPITPYVHNYSVIYMRFVPPFITDQFSIDGMKPFGKVISIKRVKLRLLHKEFSHKLLQSGNFF